MCGIFGWFGTTPPVDGTIERMGDLLHHRGPDDSGYEQGVGWGLGFRRLSILDLSPLGHQPMRSPDGRWWLAFNGEIYNYVELRHDLERLGERFRSGSDTEVLLRVLARHGLPGLNLLNGMFALALVDTVERRFLLARDRAGVKPLYYTLKAADLRFASELKALLAWPDARRQVDRSALPEYLALGYLPEETCIYAGYAKLPPGHVLSGSLDAPAEAMPQRYWQLSLNGDPSHRSLRADELQEMQALLSDAVRIRLRSDVPVGIFLSGGIDSGLIAALARDFTGARPVALTVGFAEADADETELARATARHAGLAHHVIRQDAGTLADVDELAWFYDEPFGDPSALPTFALSRMAAQHATVFLGGDGGDEAFGGYRRYTESLRLRQLIGAAGASSGMLRALSRLAPALSVARLRLLKLGLPDDGAAAVFDALPLDPAIAAVLHPDLRPAVDVAGRTLWQGWARSRGTASLTARQQALDYAMYLPGDVLTKVDRASMAHSIEVRAPFLDYRLVEWAARLPRGTLLNTQNGKLPLRNLAAQLLPPAVAQGRKRGFDVPLDDWFRAPDGVTLVQERLISANARRDGLWDSVGVAKLLAHHRAGRGRGFGLLLWRLLMLDAWAGHYGEGAGMPVPLRARSMAGGPAWPAHADRRAKAEAAS
ncbi:asparagine synthase (glutamine-hydrolyzing) [Belnapia sp. T6]|uniref:asparagine synthase (glutamine-hydrolyzing) n=1 Tax=Belnapia mucosa TaxID=2804532 RepID=A0ABS1VBP0_9PROT|nr:asparagine synthase (glutamine-hydrolyzing) [Belnapia mucosa]MBL6459085.1 asparagine synthase (glutamine-hydrolyzing) [Belnapia mucosa]